MKKVFAAIPGVLAAFYAIIPIVYLISVIQGKDLELYHPLLMAILLTVFAIAAVTVMIIFKQSYGIWNGLPLSAVLLFDAVTQFYFIYYAINSTADYNTAAPAIIMLFGSTAVVVMFIKCIEDSVFKAIFAVITVLFAIAAAALSVYALIQTLAFGETLYAVGPASPDGTYECRITYRESGLITDGETYVYAVDMTESGAFVGKFKNKPVIIYTGAALEYDHLSVEWVDSETLLINSGTYKVSAQEESEEH